MMKRIFDVTIVVVLSGLIIPIVAVIALLVKLFIGAPVFFAQVRPGKKGRPFTMIKFRSMTDAKSSNGEVLADELRLTTFGKFLRSTSLDELPELWNVVKGEMSLVGPRPLLMEYLPKYTSEQARRHEVLPGITGWAQVNGRNTISWKEKFKLDVWYVDNKTIWLDIRIMLLTARKVFLREDVSPDDCEIMPRFDKE